MPPTALPRPDRRRMLALLALCRLAGPARAQGFDLAQLMETLAQVQAGEATFTETRTVTTLDRTLMSSGRLSFHAPDTFVRETLRPSQEKIAVTGNEVTMSRGSRSRTVPLDSVPEAAVIMEAIRGTLTGNRVAIDRNFSSAVSGTAQHWTLELKPRDMRLAQLVTAVRVSGENATLREVAVALASGDRSVMSISPLAAPGMAPTAGPASGPASGPAG